MEQLEIQSCLESCELFKGLDKKNIEEILDLCEVKTFQAGEYVFQQGDLGEHIYIIMEGHVSLERSVDLGQRKGKAVIGMLGRGRAFGCWSTLLGEPHHLMSSALCQKPLKVVMIKGDDLRYMMVRNTELGFNILEKICFLLRDRIQSAFGAMEKI